MMTLNLCFLIYLITFLGFSLAYGTRDFIEGMFMGSGFTFSFLLWIGLIMRAEKNSEKGE